MKQILLLSWIIISLCSCSKRFPVGIVVENGSIASFDFDDCLSSDYYETADILDSMKIILLETNNLSLIGNPYQVILTDKRIYIRDDYQEFGLIIFDSNGKYLKRIERGNGPGEFARIVKIGFDQYRQELLVLTNPLLIKYDMDGNYLSTIQLDYPADNIVGCTEDCYLLSKVYGHQCYGYDGLDDYSLLVSDKDGNLEQMFMPYNNTVIPGHIGSYANEDKIVVGVSHCDSMFYFQNDSLYYFRKIDITSKKLDINQFKSFNDYIKDYLSKEEVSELCFDGRFFETISHVVMPLLSGQTTYEIFMDKHTRKVCSGRYQRYYSDETIAISTPIGVSDGWFYALGSPADYKHGSLTNPKYLSREDVAKLESLSPDDNPYIMFYKLKRFE